VKPFLKWAGGKQRLVARIKALMPEGGRLIEPFVGSGAVFLSTQYERFLLADANPDLINTYRYLQREGSDFVAACLSPRTTRRKVTTGCASVSTSRAAPKNAPCSSSI
jgi:DNA adenine methylase